VLLLLAGVVVLAGLGARALLPAAAGGPAGDALYATLVVVLVALVRPRTPAWLVATVGFGLCVVIELFQLTGVPATLAEHWPPARLVLGTTFAATDLLRYAVGALVGGVVCALAVTRRARRSGIGSARRPGRAPRPTPRAKRRAG
jgi:glycerol uptake facilitator-like aquaporin